MSQQILIISKKQRKSCLYPFVPQSNQFQWKEHIFLVYMTMCLSLANFSIIVILGSEDEQ